MIERTRQWLRRRRNRLAKRILRQLPRQRVACSIGPDRVLTLTAEGHAMVLSAHDLSITPSIVLWGKYEPNITRLVQRLLKPGMTAIDVGANCGWFPLVMGSIVGPKGRVAAIEPNPAVYELLVHNLLINGLLAPHGCATTVGKAVTEAPGEEVTLFVRDRLTGSSSLFRPSDHQLGHEQDAATPVQVQTTSIDALVEELGLQRVDLVKIDTEGHEYGVVRSMERTLSANPGLQLVFELTPWGVYPRGLLEALTERGYALHALPVEGEPEPRTVDELLDGEQHNVWAAPRRGV